MNIGNQHHGDKTSGFRPDVEGLRAIAILFVALYHAGLPQLPGGFVGVDIFFVLSGFLITGLLVREIETSGSVNFATFYARRARRLLPAAALVIIVTVLVAQFIYAPQELIRLAKDAITTSLYASNLWFAHISTDYLSADAAKSPLLHSWSLSVEEQFYMVWPLFIFLALRTSKDAVQRRQRLLIAMMALAVLSLALSLWLTQIAQPWAFFASPTRAWEFAAGALVSQLPAHWAASRPRLAQTGFWLGLLLIGAAATLYGHHTVFPGIAAIVPVLGTALMLACHTPATSGLQTQLLGNPLMQWIGSRSYSWYLWHWPVLVLAWRIFPDHKDRLPLGLACLALSLALAELSCRIVENPIRFNRTLSRRPAYSLALALLLTVVTAGSSEWWRHSGGRDAALPDQIRFTRAMDDIPTTIYKSNCHLSLMEVETSECVFGDVNASTTIALFGDSHAAQWFPALDALARKHQWRLVSYTKSSCPVASLLPFNNQLGRPYTECAEWREKTMQKIISQQPALVVMGYYAGYVSERGNAENQLVSAADWQKGMRTTFSLFEQSNVAVAVMRDTPRPGFDVPLCLAQKVKNAGWRDQQCDYSRDKALDVEEYQLTRNAAADLKNVSFIDLSQSICTSAQCSPIDHDSGIVLFRDSHHLTTEFVRHLAPELRIALADAMAAGQSATSTRTPSAYPFRTADRRPSSDSL